MKSDLALKPATRTDQLLAVSVFSELLAAESPGQLAQKITQQLRELTGAHTVLLLAHAESLGPLRLLHASPPRRANLFTPEELAQLCTDGSAIWIPPRR
jgi:hypothetical protein